LLQTILISRKYYFHAFEVSVTISYLYYIYCTLFNYFSIINSTDGGISINNALYDDQYTVTASSNPVFAEINDEPATGGPPDYDSLAAKEKEAEVCSGNKLSTVL